jgi:hemolysin III
MREQTRREEVANVATHGAGVLMGLGGGATLIVLAALTGSAWKVVGVSIFAAALVLLYTASTSYHWARRPRLKRRLKVLDHAAIYVLIAGTYTPFTLDAIRGPWGWTLFGVIWGLAAVGVVFKLFFVDRFHRISTAVYVAMGWLVVVAAGPMVARLEPAALAWLVAGGVAYTAGTAFYHSRRIPFAHAFWHVAVIAGSVCHGIAVGVQL